MSAANGSCSGSACGLSASQSGLSDNFQRTPVNSFRARRGLAAEGPFSAGPRIVPALKKAKTMRSTSKPPAVYKSVSVTEVDFDNELLTIVDVKIDLTKLQRWYGNFSVKDIQREVASQLDHTGVLIILYKNGTPVKDSQNTRGIENWNNKATIRAMTVEIFKYYKPTSYQAIKNDYDLTDEIPDAPEDPEESLFPELDFSPKLQMDQTLNKNHHQTYSNNSSNVNIEEKIADVKTLLTSFKDEMGSVLKQKASGDLANVFKCLICMEISPSSFYACPFCGRYLGCFDCLKRVKKCPICRKKFQCTTCSLELQKHPLLLPGITDFISSTNTPTPTPPAGIVEGTNYDSDGAQSAETIPIADSLTI